MGGMERTRPVAAGAGTRHRIAKCCETREPRDRPPPHRTHLLLRFLFSNLKATDDGDDVTGVASSPAQVFAVPLCC